MRIFSAVPILLLLCSAGGAQQLRLPPIFSDHAVLQRDRPVLIWGTARAGAAVEVTLAGNKASVNAEADGTWKVDLPAHVAGGLFQMIVRSGASSTVVNDLLFGDVWLASGQSNMQFTMRPLPPWSEGVLDYETEIAASRNNQVRFFVEPVEAIYTPKREVNGAWEPVSPESACNLSAVAWYFAREVQQKTGVPIGIVSAAVGATDIASWMEASRQSPGKLRVEEQQRSEHAQEIVAMDLRRPAYYAASNASLTVCRDVPGATMHWPFHQYLYGASGTYNAMIAPLRGIKFRGVIWYQGEGDAPNAMGYAERMAQLIENWRSLFDDRELPFYYVMLSNRDFRAAQAGKPGARPGHYAELRGEQMRVLTIPHTGMAVATDVGDPMLTHPRDKRSVGERLALQALQKSYGQNVQADGPLFHDVHFTDGKAVVRFETGKLGLMNRTGSAEPEGFELAGPDGKFIPAHAVLRGDTVLVSSPVVAQPCAVRYGWADDPRLSLFNRMGLPAPPFSAADSR